MGIDVLQEAVRTLESGQPAALVTVVASGGMTPAKPGFKMLVRPDGRTTGTVGGGALEAQAVQAALAAIRSRASTRLCFSEECGGLAQLGMVCGGEIELFVDYMSPGPEVWVFGAGHVGLAVGELAAFTGFRVTLVDDRPEYADEKRAPWAHSMMACDFVDAASKAPGGADSYVVIVTRGHAWDAQVLYEILRLEPRPYYVGMMGSKPKVKSCFDGLRAKGVSEEALAVVHAPIGLAIGGDSPREIAVSVVAEMVAARNGRDPKCLQGGAGYGGASNA